MSKRSFLKDSKFTMNRARVKKAQESSRLSNCSFEETESVPENVLTTIAYALVDAPNGFKRLIKIDCEIIEETTSKFIRIDITSKEFANPEKDKLQVIDNHVRDEIHFLKGGQKKESVSDFLRRNGKIKVVKAKA